MSKNQMIKEVRSLSDLLRIVARVSSGWPSRSTRPRSRSCRKLATSTVSVAIARWKRWLGWSWLKTILYNNSTVILRFSKTRSPPLEGTASPSLPVVIIRSMSNRQARKLAWLRVEGESSYRLLSLASRTSSQQWLSCKVSTLLAS